MLGWHMDEAAVLIRDRGTVVGQVMTIWLSEVLGGGVVGE